MFINKQKATRKNYISARPLLYCGVASVRAKLYVVSTQHLPTAGELGAASGDGLGLQLHGDNSTSSSPPGPLLQSGDVAD